MNLKKISFIFVPAALILFFVCQSPPVNNWKIKKGPQPKKIVFIGDSLTAGYGLKNLEESFPNQLATLLKLPMSRYGYSGFTSGNILKKLIKIKDEEPTLVILTIGGNDILKKVKLAETEKNLENIFTQLQALKHTIVFTEVLSIFDSKRHKMHRRLCQKFKIALIPDIMAGMLNDNSVLQDNDLIHPNVKGCGVIAKKIYDVLEELSLVNWSLFVSMLQKESPTLSGESAPNYFYKKSLYTLESDY